MGRTKKDNELPKPELKVDVKELILPMAEIAKEVAIEKATPVAKKAKEKAAPVAKKAREKAKKAITETKKVVEEKAEIRNTNVYIQYQGIEVSTDDLVDKVKKAYVADGHRKSSIKDVRVYIKPEEGCVYYVINGKSAGKVSL